LDYTKYRYEQAKKKKEVDRKQRESAIKTKEIKFHPGTDKNDLRVKANKAAEILADGNRVKISILFRGRELSHREIGLATLNEFTALVPNLQLMGPPTTQGRILSVIGAFKK
jgi:translation initiation factor IF-3